MVYIYIRKAIFWKEESQQKVVKTVITLYVGMSTQVFYV